MDKTLRSDPIFHTLVHLQAAFVRELLSAPPAFREELAVFNDTEAVRQEGASVPEELVEFNAALAKLAKATHVTLDGLRKANERYIEDVMRPRLNKATHGAGLDLKALVGKLNAELPDGMQLEIEEIADDGSEASLKG